MTSRAVLADCHAFMAVCALAHPAEVVRTGQMAGNALRARPHLGVIHAAPD